ncbi:hypothetical protein [Bradyrhizobium sp. WD16]|uniref:hypothetical protein n=1 Tax=Bradyrhizobium sp. WD16 TaxID=1521768 RepID=UPI0020A2E0AB|nr:hypothetical protein [Bradyrhizobium sp. WD16]UTD30329.1 hypothetical protein DB459_10890 [Bradyrhizobium sp. WD16]
MTKVAVAAVVLACVVGAGGPADAKGCLKGAVVGGIAGHYVGHHGFMGAAAGCVVGRHEASKRQTGQPQDANSQRR